MTCEHKTHGNDASANGRLNPDAWTSCAPNFLADQAPEEYVDSHAAARKRADNPARAAADVEHRPLSGDQFCDVSKTLPLPVAL